MKKQSCLFLIGGILSLIIAMGIGRFAYTPILPLMQKDLSFSNTVAGYIASSNYAGYLLGAILAGAIPLKKYRVIILKISLIISIFSTAIMGLTYSHFIWYVLRFLSGVSSAYVLVVASGIVLDKLATINKTSWSGATFMGITTLATTLGRQINPSNSSRTIGILTAIFAIGQFIGPILSGVLSSFTHNFNTALIGASTVVLIGAGMLLNGIQFERKSYEKDEGYTC